MIGERGDADGLRRRSMPAHDVAMHVRAVGEVQHHDSGSSTLGRVAAHSVTATATINWQERQHASGITTTNQPTS